MTVTDFSKYKSVSNKVIQLLTNEKSSSIHDIMVIYNIIMKFAYCLDAEGHYTYNGEFYNSVSDLPKEALEQLSYHLSHYTTI